MELPDNLIPPAHSETYLSPAGVSFCHQFSYWETLASFAWMQIAGRRVLRRAGEEDILLYNRECCFCSKINYVVLSTSGLLPWTRPAAAKMKHRLSQKVVAEEKDLAPSTKAGEMSYKTFCLRVACSECTPLLEQLPPRSSKPFYC